MHTEEQARKLWCPFARVLEGSPPGGAGVNRSWPEANFHCAASYCMAWRWGDGEFTNEPEHVKRPLKDQRRGYCGLAGQVKQ